MDADGFPGMGKTRPPPSRGERFGRLLVYSIDDLDTAPERGYLLKGLISPGEVSLWVGAPKCGKSFLLMFVAYKLSLARSVFGRRVKPTKVLYVAAEGEGGITKRLRALRDRYGRSANFHFIAQPIDLLREEGHKGEVIDAAEAIGAQLIVIDTLNRALAGGDESAPRDMGMLVTNVSHIRAHTGAHIAIIHHGTKASDGKSSRGHGSLEGADDAMVVVEKQADGTRCATVIHAKDDADGTRWGFTLEMVELGTDEDGDPITTLIANELAEAPERATKQKTPSAKEQIALTIFDKAMKAEGTLATVGPDHEERPVLTEAVWRQWFYAAANPGETQEAKRQTFKRAVDGLLAKDLIAVQECFIWRPGTW